MKLKPLSLKFVSAINKIFNALMRLLRFFNFWLNVIITYLSQSECQKFKDCLLLHRLLKNQPTTTERQFEYPWLMENLSLATGKLLDVGSTASSLLNDYLNQNVELYVLNINPDSDYGRIKSIKGDIRQTSFPENFFDAITCISTLEHIGVVGRYQSDDDPDGDLKAMKEIKRILKSNGQLLLTFPYGAKDVLPINRLYNKERVAKLFQGYTVESEKFIKYDKKFNIWLTVSETEAAKTDMFNDRWYAVAFYKLINNK